MNRELIRTGALLLTITILGFMGIFGVGCPDTPVSLDSAYTAGYRVGVNRATDFFIDCSLQRFGDNNEMQIAADRLVFDTLPKKGGE